MRELDATAETVTLADAVVDADAVRFRPIFLTTMTVVVGASVIPNGRAGAVLHGELLLLRRTAFIPRKPGASIDPWNETPHFCSVGGVSGKLTFQPPLFTTCLGVEQKCMDHCEHAAECASPQARPPDTEGDQARVKWVTHDCEDAGLHELRIVPRSWECGAVSAECACARDASQGASREK